MYALPKNKSVSILCLLLLLFSWGFAEEERPMNFEDIVSMSKPKNVTLSPVGTHVAFVTRRGILQENCNRETLFLYSVHDKREEALFSCDEIVQTSWKGNENAWICLCKEEQDYSLRLISSKDNRQLTRSRDPIGLFTLSSHGGHLYYTVRKGTPDQIVKERLETGYVYKWNEDSFFQLCKDGYRHLETEEIWQMDLHSGCTTRVTELPISAGHLDILFIDKMQTSEEGRFLIAIKTRSGHPQIGESPFKHDLYVWDCEKKSWWLPFSNSIKNQGAICWINEREFLCQEYLDTGEKMTSEVWVCDALSHTVTRLDWLSSLDLISSLFINPDKNRLFGMSKNKLYSILPREKKVDTLPFPQELKNHSLSLNQEGSIAATIAENTKTPPEVVLYDLKEEKMTRLTHLNPTLDSLLRGDVERIEVPITDGKTSVGYLVYPLHYQIGKRYPIIIGTYGFNENRFIADGQWHSSFPVQPLAAEGYLVLLLNSGGGPQNLIGNPEKTRELLGWNLLPLFEHAVDMLVERGMGDPTKVGLYGWSYGGFVIEFLISHSKRFHVACMGEGGDYNPSEFFMCGDMSWIEIFHNTFGGPPWGKSLLNYLDFSPFFLVDRIDTPLLMEFASDKIYFASEMYSPLRYLNIPAELVIYPGEQHNFVGPKARVASMARKLDWFNYWLQDKRDPDPSKAEQYERWDQMAKAWENRAP